MLTKCIVVVLSFVSFLMLASYGFYLLYFIKAPSGLWVLWGVNLTLNVLLLLLREAIKAE